ncbi:MAG TPA: Sec-independent protein translocase protein TatB [Rhizomicrobium sp.]|nr:Sec-independent protein translocase protein TatB [Rhizomicrobium sp.]
MLDLSWSHILILLIVALVVVGPKDLPRLMRILGQWMAKARQMANEFRKSFDDMARQSELDELRKEIESLRNERPLADVAQALNQPIIPPDMRSAPSVTVAPVEVETAAAVAASDMLPEPGPEPREGEFEVTHEPPGGEREVNEPVAADGYTPPKP